MLASSENNNVPNHCAPNGFKYEIWSQTSSTEDSITAKEQEDITISTTSNDDTLLGWVIGTGQGYKCYDKITSYLWPDMLALDYCRKSSSPCPIDGVMVPPLTGHFYALSGYYFVFDCIRILLNDQSAISRYWYVNAILVPIVILVPTH